MAWDSNTPRATAGTMKFRQSTFQGGGLSPASLRKRSAEFVPVLSEAGLAERWLFDETGRYDAARTIAVKHRRIPKLFFGSRTAFGQSREISDRFSH